MKKKIIILLFLTISLQIKANDIFWAIQNNKYEKVKSLLQEDSQRANIGKTNKFGLPKTPLSSAVLRYKNKSFEGKLKKEKEHNLKIIELLLEYGANPNYRVEGQNTLIFILASHDTNIPIVELLIKYGANIDNQNNILFLGPKNNTALHRAIDHKALKMAKFLLTHGANPSIQNSEGDTPLHRVFWEEEEEEIDHKALKMAKFLLTHKANPSIQNSEGDTPLHRVFWEEEEEDTNNNKKLMMLLLRYGTSINQPNNRGQTPLYPALFLFSTYHNIRYKQHMIKNIKTLLLNGANINHKIQKISNNQVETYTPIDIFLCNFSPSLSNQHYLSGYSHQDDENEDQLKQELLRLLLQNGANIDHINEPYIQSITNLHTSQFINLLKQYIQNKDILRQNIKTLSESMLQNQNIGQIKLIIQTIKNLIFNPWVPAYNKLLALSYLAFVQQYDGICCFSANNLKKLLTQIPSNYNFFNHDACSLLRDLVFTLPVDIIDINGQTIEEAICHFPDYLSILLSKKRMLFFTKDRWYSEEKLTLTAKKLLFQRFKSKQELKLNNTDLQNPLIKLLHEKINIPYNKEANIFRNMLINWITSTSLTLYGPRQKNPKPQPTLPDISRLPDEILFHILSYKKEDIGLNTYLPPKKLMPQFYDANYERTGNPKRKRTILGRHDELEKSPTKRKR